ncbi:MAG: efflux transporter outer membrane subunit [Sinobacteraceae bacterium]|nr:efflux transporter outer membrane subunit [Nevskiaceae bacterium]MCP5338599.1 efflux transporter outer membrane subunit [Nevskiaceae bacterium]MCP5466722.1 efflux transporter outer membrane subunit [Nevskiaceae bacterium]
MVERTAALMSALLLAGCALGPDYRPPQAPAPLPDGFVQAQGATVDSSAPVAAEVWKSFGEPELDALIARAQQENRGIAQARARLEQARALRGLTFWGLLPSVTAAGQRERSEASRSDPFMPPGQGETTVYRAGLDASWEIDLFGRSRRATEAARGDLDASIAEAALARLAVTAEVAQTWFALRGAEERLAIQRRNLDNLREDLDILERRLQAGRGTELDTARQRTLVATVAAQLPETEAELARQEQRLALLTVLPVAELRGRWLAASKTLPKPPSLVAVGTPEQWLRRRPDVRAADRRLAAATARIGVQQADYFPRLTLNGSFGYTSQLRSELFKSQTERHSYGPSLSWAFLDVGRVRQRVLQARAQQREALAAYDETLLRALEETENALAGYRAATESLAANESGLEAARTAVEISRARYDAGASDYLAVLDAERSALDFEDRFVRGSVARATALAALYKALAGDFARAE